MEEEKTIQFTASLDDLVDFFSRYVHEYNTEDPNNRDVGKTAIRAALEDYFEHFKDCKCLTFDHLVRAMTINYRFKKNLGDISPDSLPVNWLEYKRYAWDETIKMILEHEEYIDRIIRTADEWVVVGFPHIEERNYMDWARNLKSYRLRIKVHDIEVTDSDDDSATAEILFSVGADKWIYKARKIIGMSFGDWKYESGFRDAETGKSLSFNDLDKLSPEAKKGNLVFEVNCRFIKDHDEFELPYYKIVLEDGDSWLSEFFIVKGKYLMSSLVDGQEISVNQI